MWGRKDKGRANRIHTPKGRGSSSPQRPRSAARRHRRTCPELVRDAGTADGASDGASSPDCICMRLSESRRPCISTRAATLSATAAAAAASRWRCAWSTLIAATASPGAPAAGVAAAKGITRLSALASSSAALEGRDRQQPIAAAGRPWARRRATGAAPGVRVCGGVGDTAEWIKGGAL